MNYLDSIKNDKSIFFLEIGAYNGKDFDGLYRYTHNNNWTGIFVEPIPEYFQQLKLNFQNIENKFFENSAITEEDGNYDIMRIVGDEKWTKGSSSLLPNKINKKYKYYKELIKGISFNSLVKKYNIKKIDVLQIDTEGYDLIILKQIIPTFKPKFISIEQYNLSYPDKMEVKKILKGEGYYIKNCKDGGHNYLCWQI
tara:strand:+ start:1519 stop:2109 length:591 start_codon:yes stop_codon:yes gene_type:complete